jgi:hypothetical protein
MYEYSDQLGYRELMVIHRDKTEGMFEVSDDWSPGRDVTKSRIFLCRRAFYNQWDTTRRGSAHLLYEEP